MNALSAANCTSSVSGSQTNGSISGFLHSVADRVFGPKLAPDEPMAPVDRDFEVQPHVIAWPPPDDASTSAAPDGGGQQAPSVPQNAVQCSSVMDPSPTSGDPTVCVVKNDDPNADPQLIACDKEITVGDNSYCVPSR